MWRVVPPERNDALSHTVTLVHKVAPSGSPSKGHSMKLKKLLCPWLRSFFATNCAMIFTVLYMQLQFAAGADLPFQVWAWRTAGPQGRYYYFVESSVSYVPIRPNTGYTDPASLVKDLITRFPMSAYDVSTAYPGNDLHHETLPLSSADVKEVDRAAAELNIKIKVGASTTR